MPTRHSGKTASKERTPKAAIKARTPAPPPRPDPGHLRRNKELLLEILDRFQKAGLGPYVAQLISGGSTRIQ